MSKKDDKIKFYSLKPILKENADYNMIIGERSNGKTYSVEEYSIYNFAEDRGQLAIVRRWDEDFKGKRGQTYFDALVKNGVVEKATKGEWTDIYYYSSRWFFCKWDNDKRITQERPFAYAFSLNAGEHDKSTSYPEITTILFDEFITRDTYIPNEFVDFMNILSTIIRYRDNVKIFMLGNTVNKYCPYFKEFGIKNISKMQQGDIDVYTYGESDLKVAVEYCATLSKSKKSNKYFAFDNPSLQMITSGAWEVSLYPHLPHKYKPKDVIFTYFIEFGDDLLQCEIVQQVELTFTYIHRKTTPIKESTDMVFSRDFSPSPYHRRRISKPKDNIGKTIWWYYANEKVFYQDNDVGEVVRNYVKWCNMGE